MNNVQSCIKQMHESDLQGILHETQTLGRLNELNAALPKNVVERNLVIQKAKLIISRNESVASAANAVEAKTALLSKLHEVHPEFHLPYRSDLPLDVFIRTFSKDLDSLDRFQCSISSLGYNGPTLLVSYVRNNSSLSSDWTRKSVIKWTPELEFSSTILFRTLFKSVAEDSCKVPQCSFLNLSTNEHLCMDGLRAPIPLKTSNSLQKTIGKIASLKGCYPSDYNQVMISEKIAGANLRDFVIKDYADLTREQKVGFFQGIGRISYLDMVAMNLDRIPQIKGNFKGFVTGLEAGVMAHANLGNIMVKRSTDSKKPFTFYAIDNNIHTEPKDVAAYEAFLKDFVNKRFKEDLLAGNIVKSMEASFRSPHSPFYHDLTIREKVSLEDIAVLDRIIDKVKKTKDQNIMTPSIHRLLNGKKPPKGYLKDLMSHKEAALRFREADEHSRKTRSVNNFLGDLNSSLSKKELAAGAVAMERKLKSSEIEPLTSFNEETSARVQRRIKIAKGERYE